MEKLNPVNNLEKQTKPSELTPTEIDDTPKGIILCYKGGKFIYRDFSNQPTPDLLNPLLTGLGKNADVIIRTIRMIDSSTFHLRLSGSEGDTRQMCTDAVFYRLLQGIGSIFNNELRSRAYLDASAKREQWDILVSLETQTFCLANNVRIDGRETRVHSILVVGDRMIGLTGEKEAVIGKLAPEVIEKPMGKLDMRMMDEINVMGKVDRLQSVPNSDEQFLASIRNILYRCNLWGEMTPEYRIRQRSSDDVDRVLSVPAARNGLDKADLQEEVPV